jgi:hypothetical protein
LGTMEISFLAQETSTKDKTIMARYINVRGTKKVITFMGDLYGLLE